jgi:hypothetical protein
MAGLGAGLLALDGDSLELSLAILSDKRLGHHLEVPLKLFDIFFE